MTEERALLPVTQVDRDAASAVAFAYRGLKDANWQKRIREGSCDDGEMVQAFAAHRLTAEQDGWVRVPVEPTEAMLEAGDAAHFRKHNDMTCIAPTEEPNAGGGPFGYAWRAMIAAAPPANIPDSTKEAGL